MKRSLETMNMEIIEALDKLNSWVRSKSYRSGARGMVYYMKHHVLWRVDIPMEHRGIVVAVKCRDCGGSGRYRDTSGYVHNHCWDCNSSGTAQLRFIETKIDNRITWHTPENKFPRSWDGGFQIDMEYAPNQVGKDLEIWEAAQLLNFTEPCFPRPYDYHTDYGTFNSFRYHLHVGKTDETICSLCGAPNDRQWAYSVSRDHVEWTDHACSKCDQAYEKQTGGRVSIFRAFAMPQHLVSHPEIQRWMQRHNL